MTENSTQKNNEQDPPKHKPGKMVDDVWGPGQEPRVDPNAKYQSGYYEDASTRFG